jgi:putative CocE/NonD family hydrolase
MTVTQARSAATPPPSIPATELIVECDVGVSMRDGVILRCDIARPKGEGRWPTIVVRTPYAKETWWGYGFAMVHTLAKQGFAVIVQDTRGRYSSDGEGEYVPYVSDGPDGADTIAWAAGLPFSSGDVFTMGISFHGYTQWASATQQPPALKAIAPCQVFSSPWRTLVYRGGVLELAGLAGWFMGIGGNVLMRRHKDNPAALMAAMGPYMAAFNALSSEGFSSLPLDRFEPLAANEIGDAFFSLIAATRASNDPIIQALTAASDYTKVSVPAYILGGWYDFFVQGAIDQFVGMRAGAATPAARERTRLVMGPWTHGSQTQISGERSFGPFSMPMVMGPGGVAGDMLKFFREQVTGSPPSAAPVKIFVMGANVWRDEQEWPIARTRVVHWGLSSAGNAASRPDDGVIGPDVGPSVPDRFVYDPAVPVPTWGGANLGTSELAGPRDQTRIEARGDVAVYTSQVLAEPLEVTGSAVVELWVASDVEDTDFVVRLVDVQPDGIAYNVADGILRARYRDDPEQTGSGKRLVPGEPTLMKIELTPTSNLFKAGHRLRLDVTSSCFPRWARNLNIWDQASATLAEAKVAHQTILHDEAHPSSVLLPVIPAAGNHHVGIPSTGYQPSAVTAGPVKEEQRL